MMKLFMSAALLSVDAWFEKYFHMYGDGVADRVYFCIGAHLCKFYKCIATLNRMSEASVLLPVSRAVKWDHSKIKTATFAF